MSLRRHLPRGSSFALVLSRSAETRRYFQYAVTRTGIVLVLRSARCMMEVPVFAWVCLYDTWYPVGSYVCILRFEQVSNGHTDFYHIIRSIRYLYLQNPGTNLIENEGTVSVRTIWGGGAHITKSDCHLSVRLTTSLERRGLHTSPPPCSILQRCDGSM